MRYPLRVRALTVLVLAFALAGCAPREASPPGGSDPRLAVGAPAAAEMLEALGLEDRVVAIGDFVDRPASIVDRPRIGPYNAPNVELLLKLRVDLYLSSEAEAAIPAHRRLAELGIDVLALPTDTYAGVLESLDRLGAHLGRKERASALRTSLEREMADLERRGRDAVGRRVLFVVGRDPLYVAGPGSHVDEMIRRVGGHNVAGSDGPPYRRLSMEAALELTPDVVVDTSDNRPEARRGAAPGGWADWPFLPAVAEGRVYHVAPGLLVIPGIRLPEMTARLGRLVHPEAYGEPLPEDFRDP